MLSINMKDIEAKISRDIILDSINEGVFTVDLDWQITHFNKAAEAITGVKRQNAIGRNCSEVFRASICESSCALKQTISTGKPIMNKTVYMISSAGRRIPIKISSAALKNEKGQIIGGVETFQDLRQIEELRKKLEKKYTFADIIGQSVAITRLFEILPQIADSQTNVLIEGASGTGKELFARAIHNLSPRKKERFVAINCGALPDTLLESELFGYKTGAFTDARKDKQGRFAIADGGTLFLDEIGDISAAMQVRLLRVLQERTYEPLGSVEPIHTNVRIIAATNKNLAVLVRKGKLREDLFYRLQVIRLELPGLRDRREDIPPLIEHFIAKFNRLQEKDVDGVSQEVLALLMEHNYPGNVRELENIIEHGFVLCRDGLIQPRHLPSNLRDQSARGFADTSSEIKLESMERILITEALRKHNGNRTLTAKKLGINISTLYRKIKSMQIEVPQTDGRNKGSAPV